MPKVYNKRNAVPANAVYVGRPSKFGNPFFMANESKRDEVCDKFEAWILSKPELVQACKQELRGRDLVCWCSPARCHADVLLAIANS
jgi:hypothetical protein